MVQLNTEVSEAPIGHPIRDIVERLRHTAGHLINGAVEDGTVETEMLCSAADEIDRLRKGIQDYLDGDYGRDKHFETKHDICPHGHFSWESCEPCIDEHFTAVLVGK